MERRNTDADNSWNRIKIPGTAAMAVIIIFMWSMFAVIRTFSCIDIMVLNLLHGTDLFLEKKDWNNSFFSIIFGVLYSAAVFQSPCAMWIVGIVVISWVSICRNYGFPSLIWIFCPCLLTWIIGLIFPYVSDFYICFAAMNTAYNYSRLREKSIVDTALMTSCMSISSAFFHGEYAWIFITLAYGLTVTWMYFK